MNLTARVKATLARGVDPAISAFAARLGEEASAKAVLFYGSNLRTGSLDGVLDFYVLTRGEAEKGIWPTVSYREWQHGGRTLRAKIATMTAAKFAYAAEGNSRDTTIWARFVQPSTLVWRSEPIGHREIPEAEIAELIGKAICTAARHAVALGPATGTEREFWLALFRETYKAELRVEKPGRENSILDLNEAHFDGLLPDALQSMDIAFYRERDLLTPDLPDAERARIRKSWNRSKRWGKPLNIARLLRATRTFEGAGRYAAWKVERHTGVKVEVTPWREKHPVLSAPGVLFKVWRAKRRAG
ncbi:hypothetical protein [Aurantiacibacter sediminis]|uniref:Nucleotidyltransferase n=1 Tax=Aurantiacibacter sediminis TaxID=2793064 RepID=A0ABS0N230_9SPHN|nr:hypothetical protein [Aurantiacibacter sediminis]MBH5321311.1 hypothetical protein [Aurantiacibacter sediminis]